MPDEQAAMARSAMSRAITRRGLLRNGVAGASLLALPGLLAACGSGSGGSNSTAGSGGGESASVTFASNGGALQDAQTRAFLDPYMKENPNVKILQDVGSTDYAKLEAQVRSGNVTWDLVDVGGDFGLGDQQDLLEPLDCTIIECATDDVAGNKYRVPLHKYAAVMGYRPDKVRSPPRTWAEWFDLDAYPGKRAIFKIAAPVGIFESALLADGVAIDRLYPLDLDRAFAKLDTIKSEIVWGPSPTDTVRLLADGEAILGNVFSSQAYAMSQDGTQIDVVWNEYGLGTDYLVVPKGSKNRTAAMRLAAYMTSAAHNAAMSNIYPTAPGNEQARPDRSADTYAFLPNDKGGTSYDFDSAWYTANQKMISQRFDEWLQS